MPPTVESARGQSHGLGGPRCPLPTSAGSSSTGTYPSFPKVVAKASSNIYAMIGISGTVSFELVVARTLQVLGADIECEPVNPVDGSRVDFVAKFSDATVFVEAVSPVLDRELGEVFGREAPLTELIKDSVPPGRAADIRALPNVGPDEPKRHIKAFLRREMDMPAPTNDDEEVEIRESFEQGELRVILFPQSRHGLSANTKIAMRNAIAYWPNDEALLRGAVKR
jgi:hypothetical protein